MDKLQCYSTNTREGIQVGSVLLVRNRESNGLDLPKPPHGYKLPPQHLPTPLSELSCLMWLAVTLDWPRKGSATMGISIDWDITMPWEEGGLSWICCCCICALSIISCVSEEKENMHHYLIWYIIHGKFCFEYPVYNNQMYVQVVWISFSSFLNNFWKKITLQYSMSFENPHGFLDWVCVLLKLFKINKFSSK